MLSLLSLNTTRRLLAASVLGLGVVTQAAAHDGGDNSSSSSSSGPGSSGSSGSFEPGAPVDQDFDAGLPAAWRTSGKLRGQDDRYVVLKADDTLQYSFRAISSGVFSFSFAYSAWHAGAGADLFDISITPGSFLNHLVQGGANSDDGGDDDSSNHHDKSGNRAYSSSRNPGGNVGQLIGHSSSFALQSGQDYLLAIRLKNPGNHSGAGGHGNSGSGGGGGGGGDGDHGRSDNDDNDGHRHGGKVHVGIDDFRVDNLALVSSVPEAHGWAMYAAGLLTLAWLGGRRRSAQARLHAASLPAGR